MTTLPELSIEQQAILARRERMMACADELKALLARHNCHLTATTMLMGKELFIEELLRCEVNIGLDADDVKLPTQ